MKKTIQLLRTKWREYLIELIVIILGILLAIALNNWNEKRKSKILERQLLQEYQEELNFNNQVVAEFNKEMHSRLNCCKVLLTAIEDQSPYVDSLSSCYYVLTVGVNLNLSLMSFNSMEAKGMDIISNKELKEKILALHTLHFGKINARISNQYSNVKEYGRPILRRRLKAKGNRTYIPLDYEALMKDVEVWNILQTLRGNYFNITQIHEDIQAHIKEIDQMIDDELR